MRRVLWRPWDGRRAVGDDGQGSVEYVGIVLVVAIILSSVTVTFTPIGESIIAKLCEALGGECSGPGQTKAPDNAPPEAECVRGSEAVEVALSASALIVDGETNVGIMAEQLSDGRYRVTLVDGGALGVSTGVGDIEAKVHIGGYGTQGGAGASAGVGLTGSYGTEYILDSAEELGDFYTWAVKEQGADLIKSTSPATGFTLDGLVSLTDRITGNTYSPPKPSATYIEGGLSVYGHAMAGDAKNVGANVDIEAAEILGVRRDSETGETTAYVRSRLEGSAALDLGLAAGADGSAGVEVVYGVTADESGKVVGVEMSAEMSADGSYDLNPVFGVETPDALEGSGSIGQRLSMTIPVTDDNRSQVVDTLTGVGVIKGIVDGQGPAASFRWLAEEAVTNGDVVIQDIDVSNEELVGISLAGELPVVKGVGVSAEVNSASTRATRTMYLGRDGWQDWEGCW